MYIHCADKPNKPVNGAGSIREILESAEAIITLNWSPPGNHDRTTIDYYELTLIGTHSNTTAIVNILIYNTTIIFTQASGLRRELYISKCYCCGCVWTRE